MKYVVKCGVLYADGLGHWVDDQKDAFVFKSGDIRSVHWGGPREWAQEHANYLGFGRVVKLVKKKADKK